MTEEDVLKNKELWPFLSAITVLKRRLLANKDKCEIFGFCIGSQVHTEQEMLFSLVTLKVFAFDVKNSIDVS